MFRRSSHIAVSVPPDQVAVAVEHYKKLFGITESVEDEDSIGLKGSNFTIWVAPASEGAPPVLQEWVVSDREAARGAVLAAGGRISGESSCGFYVIDPFGMAYHVYVEDGNAPD